VVVALQTTCPEKWEAAMRDVAGPDDAIAVLDLDLRHVAVTDAYAELLGAEPATLLTTAIAPRAANADEIRDALARLLFGEIDYCVVPAAISATGTPVLLHAAMVREPDATPRCIAVTAHAVPSVAHRDCMPDA
jgi:hypothetical protein